MPRAVFCESVHGIPDKEPVIRWDLAWGLFLPDCESGVLPKEDPDTVHMVSRWFWEAMGKISGHLRIGGSETIWMVTPALSEGAREFITRLASFWCDEVYWNHPFEGEPNHWAGPVIDVMDTPDSSLMESLTFRDEYSTDRYLVPATGVGRVFMKVQEIAAGRASARLHSHSAVDEYYLILKGHGTLRMTSHQLSVGPGSLISKPTGPDLTSHIIADQGEAVTVLDMEVYSDARHYQGLKDVVAYTDHQELLLGGVGWRALIPQPAMMTTEGLSGSYFDGYVRGADGGVTPQAFPGHPAQAVQKNEGKER